MKISSKFYSFHFTNSWEILLLSLFWWRIMVNLILAILQIHGKFYYTANKSVVKFTTSGRVPIPIVIWLQILLPMVVYYKHTKFYNALVVKSQKLCGCNNYSQEIVILKCKQFLYKVLNSKFFKGSQKNLSHALLNSKRYIYHYIYSMTKKLAWVMFDKQKSVKERKCSHIPL